MYELLRLGLKEHDFGFRMRRSSRRNTISRVAGKCSVALRIWDHILCVMSRIEQTQGAHGVLLRVRWIAFTAAALAFNFGPAMAATFFVAPNGSDTNAGTFLQPFATLEKARDTLRQIKSSNPLTNKATVFVRGGTYYRTNTFNLDARDSGLNTNAPVIFQAYSNEVPVLIGGLLITNLVPWQGDILKADVGAQGFKGSYFRQLFFNGHRQWLARYPNFVPADPYGSGWSYVDGALGSMYASLPNDSRTNFTCKPGDLRNWARPAEAEVFIFPRYNWWNNIVPVHSINTTSRVINLRGMTSYPIRPGDRYFIRNVFEELDAPGEWYLDAQTWTLYFWPPYGVKSDRPVYAPLLRTIVAFGAGTANVTFQGFKVECSEGTAISLTDATNCLIAANTVVNVGDYNGSGIKVSGGFNNGVVGNDVSYVGREGIEISGGVTKTLTPAQNYAENNYIHHMGVFYKQGAGVWLTGVGNRASHNLIHDGPRFGIYFHGQNLVIEYNHVRDVMLETDDGGIIYSFGINWLGSRGSTVRYNHLHDASGWGFHSGSRGVPWMTWGIYLDGFTSGVDVLGNVVTKVSNAGVYVNGGSENRVFNNIFANNIHGAGAGTGNQQIYVVGYPTNNSTWTVNLSAFNAGFYSVYGQPAWSGMRGMSTAPTNISYGAAGYTISSNLFHLNLVIYTNSPTGDWAYRTYNIGGDRNLWKSNHIYYSNGSPTVVTNSSEVTWSSWKGMGQDEGSLTGDPMINSDFTLKSSSPLLTLGFQQIPISQIGPYQGSLRATWPIVEARGAREGFQRPAPPEGLAVAR